jgi:hypothetical protein
MARAYSAAYKSTLADVSSPEAPLILLEIDHADLTSPVRVVNDTLDITSNGNAFVAMPFRCELPDDFEGQLPKARLAIDNIGRELMVWIETSSGGAGSTCRFMQVMRSRPDTVEWEITMNLYNVRCTMREVSADLGFENLFSRSASALTYRPDIAPGIF